MNNHGCFEIVEIEEFFPEVDCGLGVSHPMICLRKLRFFPEWSVESRYHPSVKYKRKWIRFRS